MSQATFYGKDVNPNAKQDYLDDVIEPAYYPDGTGEAHLDKKYVKYWLSPMLDMVEEGRQNFAPQFWGDTVYGILVNQYVGSTEQPFADAIPLSEMKAIIASRTGATDFGSKLNTSRTYSTYCPAKIGYDPVNVGYFPDMVTGIGGTTSVTGGVRDSSFVPYTYLDQRIRLYLFGYTGAPQQTFLFYADGATDNTDSTHSAYTQPPCFIGDGITYPNQASDLHAYLVTSTVTVPTDLGGTIVRYTTNWVVYSESNNFYRIFPAIDLGLAYGEPTNEPEGDEPEVPIPYPTYDDSIGINSGYLAVYKMGYDQMQAFASDMWDDNVLSQIGHLFGDNPNYSDVIISLSVLPYPDDMSSIVSSTAVHIGIGNTQAPHGTGFPASKRIYYADFNGVTIDKPHDGSFLDYAPYTTVTAYLPFIGFVQLPPKFVIGHTVEARYAIDIITGGCTCFLKNESVGVFSVHTGTCMYAMPVSQSQGGHWYDAIQAAITGGLNLASSGHVSSCTSHTIKYDKRGNVKSDTWQEAGSRSVPAFGGLVETAQHAFDTTTTVRGGVGGTNGFTAWVDQIPIWVESPKRADTGDYISTKGVPIAQSMALSECTGFTQVEAINLHGVSATKDELDELEVILKTGFIAPPSGVSVVQPTWTAATSGRVTVDCYSRTAGVTQLNTAGSVSSITINHTGAFRDTDTPSFTDPVILLNASASTLQNCNYMHITEFGRYYFVTNIIALTSETSLVMLHVDVLNSFWSSISTLSAYIGRMDNETLSNPYIVDSSAVLESDRGICGQLSGNNVFVYELAHPNSGSKGAYVLLTASH